MLFFMWNAIWHMLSQQPKGAYYYVLCLFVVKDTRYSDVSFILEGLSCHASKVWTTKKLYRSVRCLNFCSIYHSF